jgi:beta-mannosidase
MNILMLTFFIWWLFPYAFAAVFDLSGLDWTLINQNGSISVPGAIPSQAHLDLLRAGVITEPLLGINGQLISSNGWSFTDLSTIS